MYYLGSYLHSFHKLYVVCTDFLDLLLFLKNEIKWVREEQPQNKELRLPIALLQMIRLQYCN